MTTQCVSRQFSLNELKGTTSEGMAMLKQMQSWYSGVFKLYGPAEEMTWQKIIRYVGVLYERTKTLLDAQDGSIVVAQAKFIKDSTYEQMQATDYNASIDQIKTDREAEATKANQAFKQMQNQWPVDVTFVNNRTPLQWLIVADSAPHWS